MQSLHAFGTGWPKGAKCARLRKFVRAGSQVQHYIKGSFCTWWTYQGKCPRKFISFADVCAATFWLGNIGNQSSAKAAVTCRICVDVLAVAMWASANSRGYDNRLFSACQHQVRLPGLAPIPCIPVQPAWAVLAEENVLLWLFQRFMRTMLLQYNPYKWHQSINKYLCHPLLKCIEPFETTSKVQNQ